MSDIVERLRKLAAVDNCQASLEAADEIERLRGGMLKMASTMSTQVETIERLRAALRDCLGWHDYSNDMHKPIEVRAAYMRARAALEEK